MALESFYGGKPGVSPVIKARFKYVNTSDSAYAHRNGKQTLLTKEEADWLNDALGVDNYAKDMKVKWTDKSSTDEKSPQDSNEDFARYAPLAPFTMDVCFADANYTNVWYGELCIIDTDNKLNPNNGKIYRRSLKHIASNSSVNLNETSYAEYIGQIVGPSGGVPQFHIGSLEEERKKAVGTSGTYSSEEPPLDNSNWEYFYPTGSGTSSVSTPNGIDNIAILSANEDGNITMVPGKVDEENYNDSIRYTWCNVRRKLDGNDEDALVYLGFEIPYTTFEVTGEEEQYTYADDLFKDESSKLHPFHKKYVFHIPRGTRGIGPEEVFCVNSYDNRTLPDNTSLYSFDAIQYNQETDQYVLDMNKKIVESPNTNNDWKNKSYWVGKWTLYNPKTKNPETGIINQPVQVYQYLGSYKDIRNVTLDKGTLTFTYSDKTTTEFNDLKYIDSIDIDTVEKIINNNEEEDNLNYGNIEIAYNTDPIDANNNNIIPSIKENLHLIKNIKFNKDNGKITFIYSDKPDSNNPNQIKELRKTTEGAIEYISEMKVDDSGYLLYQYNNQNTWNYITDGSVVSEEHDNRLRIKDISQMRITDYGQLEVQYRGDVNLVENEDPEILWTNIGPTSTFVNTGPVCLFSNTIYESRYLATEAINGSSYEESTNYPKIGGAEDGRITIDENIDRTGGLVGIKVRNSNTSNESSENDPVTPTENDPVTPTENDPENNSETPVDDSEKDSYYIALYWYNRVSKKWMFVGAIGAGADKNYELYITEGNEVYPNANMDNAAFYFETVSQEAELSKVSQFEVIGFLPWESQEQNVLQEQNVSG